jgi:hypothetical protein
MAQGPAHEQQQSSHAQLTHMIRRVRRRWRTRVALRGLAIVVVAALAAMVIGAYGMDQYRFSPQAITGGRVLVWLALAAAVLRFLVLPLSRRVSDERVALYIEEHEPTLEASLLSALDSHGAGDEVASSALTRRLVEQAVERARKVEFGARVDRPGLQRGTLVASARPRPPSPSWRSAPPTCARARGSCSGRGAPQGPRRSSIASPWSPAT